MLFIEDASKKDGARRRQAAKSSSLKIKAATSRRAQ